ncbi:MAG: response regulator [Gemmatimonadales bacterium]|nr:response regulator [Gemmatimonadales bacterium]
MSPKVLVVDDDAGVRKSLAKLLRAEGYRVTAEADGMSALRTVKRLDPDVILLDVRMPELDGVEVCRRLKAKPETRLTPVVLMTGLSVADDRARGRAAGADDFLPKPPERIELLARVESLARIKSYADQLAHAEAALLTLARSIEAKDPYTEGHCERLSSLATELGRRLGLGEEEILALERAGVLHDIGKVAVPDEILLKHGPLTPEEWEVMRRHPITGEYLCSRVRSLRLVLPIIRHHHEKYDGSGYPDGLAADDIPLTARVLQVVDMFDALTRQRPYREALSSDQALETMRDEVDGGRLDPDVFAEFSPLVIKGEDGA